MGDSLVQLTWRAGAAIVWDRATLTETGRFGYAGEGWGLCHDGRRLYHSDGSEVLTVRDPRFAPVQQELGALLDEFEDLAAELDYRPAELPLVSNLWGRTLSGGERLDGVYWRRHAREPVQFARSVQTLSEVGCQVLMEVGPHPVLTGMAASCVAWRTIRSIRTTPRSPRTDESSTHAGSTTTGGRSFRNRCS